MSRVSMVFHVLLFLVPLLLPAHNILFRQTFHFALPTLPEPLMDVLTLVLLAFGAFFLVRRIVFPRVRALTTVRDYLVLLLVAAPFVSAYMAYHQWLDYRTVLVISYAARGDLHRGHSLHEIGSHAISHFRALLESWRIRVEARQPQVVT